jgi:hypothetical protein
VSEGWEVPSSDTNPSMDPAESKTYTERETLGSTSVPSSGSGSGSGSQSSAEPRSMGQQGSGISEGQGRDESDRQMGGEESGGGSSTRTHPVARTAATAIGSAAGMTCSQKSLSPVLCSGLRCAASMDKMWNKSACKHR